MVVLLKAVPSISRAHRRNSPSGRSSNSCSFCRLWMKCPLAASRPPRTPSLYVSRARGSFSPRLLAPGARAGETVHNCPAVAPGSGGPAPAGAESGPSAHPPRNASRPHRYARRCRSGRFRSPARPNLLSMINHISCSPVPQQIPHSLLQKPTAAVESLGSVPRPGGGTSEWLSADESMRHSDSPFFAQHPPRIKARGRRVLLSTD